MSDNPRTLVFAAFDSKDTADVVVAVLKELKKKKVFDFDAWGRSLKKTGKVILM